MASSETQAVMDETIAVLVVDDDASIQSIVEETLSDGGFDPTVASSGEEAIALLNANSAYSLSISPLEGITLEDGPLPDGLGHSTQACPSFISPAETPTIGRSKVCRTAFCLPSPLRRLSL